MSDEVTSGTGRPFILFTVFLKGETELSFRLIPSLTQSHTKPRAETVRDEVILAKEGISLKDNTVSPCIIVNIIRQVGRGWGVVDLIFFL